MHLEIFDPERKKILPRLVFLKTRGFYLAGGTALALHLGHRRSIDFDFYNFNTFDEMRFEQEIVSSIPDFKVTQRSSGTLIGQKGQIDLSFFYYPYVLLEAVCETDYFNMASVADIAAMKLVAVSQRGLRRDFLDLYMISQQSGLEAIFGWAQKKYSQFDRHVALKALTYFEDAESDHSGRGMELTSPIAWATIKSYFERVVLALSKKWL